VTVTYERHLNAEIWTAWKLPLETTNLPADLALASPELSVGWVDPRVGLGWVGNGSEIFVFSGFGWFIGLTWQIWQVVYVTVHRMSTGKFVFWKRAVWCVILIEGRLFFDVRRFGWVWFGLEWVYENRKQTHGQPWHPVNVALVLFVHRADSRTRRLLVWCANWSCSSWFCFHFTKCIETDASHFNSIVDYLRSHLPPSADSDVTAASSSPNDLVSNSI